MKTKRSFIRLIITLLLLTFLTQPTTIFAKNTDVLTEEMKTELIKEINEFRAENGIPSIKYNTNLQKGVNLRANEIITHGSHNRPDASPWFTAFDYTSEFIKQKNGIRCPRCLSNTTK